MERKEHDFANSQDSRADAICAELMDIVAGESF